PLGAPLSAVTTRRPEVARDGVLEDREGVDVWNCLARKHPSQTRRVYTCLSGHRSEAAIADDLLVAGHDRRSYHCIGWCVSD
ncbi:MAG TPA: hypothetical protein PLB21_07305, partial [Actinomycetota bacterium]|nr:hypothetical protein [Actinomycetota bacterium]